VCYVDLPAADVEQSSSFYAQLFGWTLRRRHDGAVSFDDGVGEVSGTWTLGRPPESNPSVLLYIWVDDIAMTLDLVVRYGGQVVQPIGADPGELTARIADPAGNIIGLYQEPTGN
jgi:predicted enzyme related to lactoylglutathione lyase